MADQDDVVGQACGETKDEITKKLCTMKNKERETFLAGALLVANSVFKNADLSRLGVFGREQFLYVIRSDIYSQTVMTNRQLAEEMQKEMEAQEQKALSSFTVAAAVQDCIGQPINSEQERLLTMLGFLALSDNVSASGQKRKFTAEEARTWSHYLRRVANTLHHQGEDGIANNFYDVHYAIGPEEEINPFGDPFALDNEYLDDVKRENPKFNFIESLKSVLANSDKIDPSVWNSGLKEYLEELLSKLQKENQGHAPAKS